MTLEEARQMVENLSRGIDSYIGREFPIQDVCIDPDVQEALRIVLDHCTIESHDQRREREKAEKIVERELQSQERHFKYPNGGKPWTRAEIGVSKLVKTTRKTSKSYDFEVFWRR